MGRKHRPRDFWQNLVEEFEGSSGLTQTAFARMKNVSLGTFRKWLYQIRQENSRPTSLVSFIEVAAPAMPSSPVLPGARLYLGQRVLLEFESLPEASYLADLLTELE